MLGHELVSLKLSAEALPTVISPDDVQPTLTAWCEHHSIPYQGVPVGTIKKHATGKGNAGKDEVIAAMRALGHAVTDDNEADALAILHWAIDIQGENA